MRLRLVLVAVVLGGLSCSVTESGTIALIWGQDDPFTEADASSPASILISAITVQSADGGSSEDAATTLAQASYQAGGTLNLSPQDGYDIDILQATIFDSTGHAIIFGKTIPEQLAGIQDTTLDIFVQRTGQFARLPQPFDAAPVSPLALTLEGQYVMIANGSGEAGATGNYVYDMNAWAPLESPIALPCSPLSIAPLGGTLILVVCASNSGVPLMNCAGSGVFACGFDTSGNVQNTTLSTPAPAGDCKGWESVAGGATVVAPNGDSFIVGGTRPASSMLGPTDCVFRLSPSNTTSDSGFNPGVQTLATFGVPRQGAAAAWSSSYGLVIAGGNQSSSDPPIEYLGISADGDGGLLAPMMPPYTVGDLAQGSGAAILDTGNTLVLAGGTLPDKSLAGVRVFNLMCLKDCEPEAGTDAGNDAAVEAGVDAAREASAEASTEAGGEPGTAEGGADAGAIVSVSLASAQGFAVTASSALFVGPAGASADGVTRAFLVSTKGTSVMSITGVPLRVSRKGTTAIWSPVSSVVVIGGDTTMESFIP